MSSLLELLRGGFAHWASPYVAISDIELKGFNGGVSASFFFSGESRSIRPVYFDFLDSPLKPVSWTAEELDVTVPRPLNPNVIAITQRNGWDSTMLNVKLELKSSKRVDAPLIFPDYLPRVLGGNNEIIPRMRITSNIDGAVGGVRLTRAEPAYLHAWILPGAATSIDAPNVTIAPELHKAVDKHDVGKIGERVTAVLNYISELLEFPIDAKMLLAAPDDIVGSADPLASCFVITPDELGLSGHAPSHGTLPFALTHLWINGVMRITGRRASQVRGALGSAMSLMWFDYINSNYVTARILAHLASVRGDVRPWALARSSRFERRTAALTITTYELMQRKPFIQRLSKFIKANVGRNVSSSTAIAELGLS
ncbi:MAG TPA: hypothetical protein VFY83_10430 [Anaerolineales bacterium]|nr:hypothetical protein [Anaerolineales bacterium]